MISLKDDIDGVGFFVAKDGLAVVGGEGFGPREARLAGSPSEIDARGRLTLLDVVDLTEPTGDTMLRACACAFETSGLDGLLATGGLGGSEGLRIAVDGVGARDDEVPDLADDIPVLLGEAVVLVAGVLAEAGLEVAGAAALAVFLRLAVADGGLEAVDELTDFVTAGGVGLTEPAPKVPELIT